MDWLKKTENRVRAAKWLLISSLILMVVNVLAYKVHWIDESDLILVTLILSWLAITFTALDILSTSDVRNNQEEDK